MKTKSIIFTLLTLAAVQVANAVPSPIDITVDSSGNAVAVPKSVLGDFGDNTVLSWLTSDVTTYNSLYSMSLPTPISAGDSTGNQGGAGGNNITLDLTGTYDYLFFHWGGKGGGWAQAYYIGGLTGDYTFDNSTIDNGAGNPAVGGLSFYSYYNPNSLVPDGGSTLLMLGAALSGCGILVRRLKA